MKAPFTVRLLATISLLGSASAFADVYKCALEGGSCTIVPSGCAYSVYYTRNTDEDPATALSSPRLGVDNQSGTIPCTSNYFGGDPLPGVLKACYVVVPPGTCNPQPPNDPLPNDACRRVGVLLKNPNLIGDDSVLGKTFTQSLRSCGGF